MVTDPVRTKCVRCGWWARWSSCYRERILRGAPAGGAERSRSGTASRARDCLGTLERSQWTGLRLSLTMPPPTSLGGEFPSRHAP